MSQPNEYFCSCSDVLRLEARVVPWDGAIYKTTVISILDIRILGNATVEDLKEFSGWVDAHQCGIMSCRLAHSSMRESFLLEDFGFRFVEMVLHPVFDGLGHVPTARRELTVRTAGSEDLGDILEIAASAFTNERFYVDPRLPQSLSHQRYARWAASALEHPRQKLLKITESERLVAFFVVEENEDLSAYWHLTAVSPKYHGQGYGHAVWLAVLRHHSENAIRSVRTTISARNSAVLNLYSKLNFRFDPAEMTFHWVRA